MNNRMKFDDMLMMLYFFWVVFADCVCNWCLKQEMTLWNFEYYCTAVISWSIWRWSFQHHETVKIDHWCAYCRAKLSAAPPSSLAVFSSCGRSSDWHRPSLKMLLPSSCGEIKIAKFHFIMFGHAVPIPNNRGMVKDLPDAIRKKYLGSTPQNWG